MHEPIKSNALKFGEILSRLYLRLVLEVLFGRGKNFCLVKEAVFEELSNIRTTSILRKNIRENYSQQTNILEGTM